MSGKSFFENTYVRIIFAMILPNIGGWISGPLLIDSIVNWSQTLIQPELNPPAWVFWPVWTFLYLSMGFASYLVWRDGGGFSGPARVPLILYGIQLILNWIWSPIYFGLHSLKWSAIEIVVLTVVVVITAISFFRINKLAGFLLVPYIAWLSFASYLNYSTYRLNTPTLEDNKTK